MSEASPVVNDPPDPPISFPDPPRAELDRRISDLVEAANEVLLTQGRLRALLRANQAIVSELDLAAVLSRVVDAARDLTGARYGALGLVDDRGALDQIVQSGMTDEELARIGRLPVGTGLLGAVMHSRDPVRLDDYRTHPRAGELPPGHPPVHDFLGVPVRVRGVLFGSLYLAGHPRGAFSEEDEQLVRSLASTAGFAIANARLYSDMRHRQQWAAASAEVTAHLLAPGDGNPLTLVADRVLELADADSVFVTMLDQEDPERIRVVEVRGGDPTGRLGSTFRTRGSASEPVLRTGEPRRLDEAATQALGVPYLKAFGPLLVLPLSTGTRVLGTLVVARKRGRRHFTEADAAMALDFAGRAGVALELHTARNDQERMLLFEERSRIARDLHDRVIQQLFATGMQLQSVLGTMPPGRGADRVDAAVSSLDAAIAQIRRVIFTLSTTDHVGPGETARQRLLDLLRELGASLSLEPALSFAGPVDGVVDAVLGDELLAVVTEAVTNAVKHARASSVSVAVSAGADGLTVVVTNDGPPPAPDGRRSGLANLEERARRRGGSMVLAADGGRTALTWTVPLPESAS